MYGYTSHIPRLQELCDWLNSIPNSWSGTLNYYHYNSNYTPSSADKLLQVNSGGSAEFTPTGVYYTNTATSKFIKEEEVRTYRFRFGTNYYDYGTVSGIALNYNAGNFTSSSDCHGTDEYLGPAIYMDHITMNDSSRTANYAEISDFEKSPTITLTKSGMAILPKIYAPNLNCSADSKTGYVKHKATNTTINYTWTYPVASRSINVEPLFTTRKNNINIVRFYGKIWITGWGDYNNSSNWETIDWNYGGTYPHHYLASYISTLNGWCSACSVDTLNGLYIGCDIYLYISAIAIDSSGLVYDVGCYGNPLNGATASNLKNYNWVLANTGYALSFKMYRDISNNLILGSGEQDCSVDYLFFIMNFENDYISPITNEMGNPGSNLYSDAALDEWGVLHGYSGYRWA